MHIPDGFLDAKTWITLDIISGGVVYWAVSKLNKKISEKQIPLIGVVAAFIFAAQMLNFPVAGGTSGHFMGSVLAAILLGPSAGVLIMTVVLMVQCFIFQDGGLTALGANIFNMGIVGSVVGFYIYIVLKKIIKNRAINAFVSAWLSIVLAAGFCAFELAISGTVPIKIALLSMVLVHALIGIGEGLITATVLGFISRVRPDLLDKT